MSNLATVGQIQSRGIALSTLDDMWSFAQIAVDSGLTPTGIKTVPQVVIALQHGLELGFTPMQALQSIAVINGRPCVWGDALVALAQASPDCEYIQTVMEGDGEHLTAVCRIKRRNRPEHESRFSWADAKRAGLTSKDTYKNYPQRMLTMRARAWAIRDIFPDVLKGVAVAEEQEEVPRSVPSTVEPFKVPQAKRPAAEPEPTASVPDVQPTPRDDKPQLFPDVPGKVTAKDVQRFWIACRETGKDEQTVRDHLIAVHGVESTKDMLPELYANSLKWAQTRVE